MAKKVLLVTSVTVNLCLLGYYKYANFFVNELNNILAQIGFPQLVWINVILPIGISFFVFHKISYVVDIYRDTEKPLTNIFDFVLYILLFPQLIAGPIVRFHEISAQIKKREHNISKFNDGIWRFSLGLGKKVLIANPLGNIVDNTFNLPITDLTSPIAWVGIVFYTFQIYFDFSGYSDMAIGLGKMFGFCLPENFNRPYIAKSVTDFWKRWHISLSRFLKDYLYIPLGGNRVSKGRHYLNLWLVFAVCGFWHGANWTFLIWGIYHGFLLILDKIFLLKALQRVPSIASNLIAFFLVLIGWVFFRSPNLVYALDYLHTMFTYSTFLSDSLLQLNINNKVILIAVIAASFSFIDSVKINNFLVELKKLTLVKSFCAISLLLYSSAVLSSGSFNPFIYFRF